MSKWKAEMPATYTIGQMPPDARHCDPEVVRDLVDRCNDELEKADELYAHYASMLLELGAARLRESHLEKRLDEALARVQELEAARWKPVYVSVDGNWVDVWASAESRSRFASGKFADPLPHAEDGSQPGYER